MNDDEISLEKIRTMLTPDVLVCKDCREKYKDLSTCGGCGTNMLDPEYKGMVYECKVCDKLYCENCKDHSDKHSKPKKEGKGLFH